MLNYFSLRRILLRRLLGYRSLRRYVYISTMLFVVVVMIHFSASHRGIRGRQFV